MLGIEDFLTEVMAIPGVLDAIMVDHMSGTPLAAGGGAEAIDTRRSASALSETFHAALDGLALSAPDGVARINDMVVTTDRGHHLFKPVETVYDGPFLIYLRLDPEHSNLALALYRLRHLSDRPIATRYGPVATPARGAQKPPDPPPEPPPERPPAVPATARLPRRRAGAGAAPRPRPGAADAPLDVNLLIRLRDALKELS